MNAPEYEISKREVDALMKTESKADERKRKKREKAEAAARALEYDDVRVVVPLVADEPLPAVGAPAPPAPGPPAAPAPPPPPPPAEPPRARTPLEKAQEKLTKYNTEASVLRKKLKDVNRRVREVRAEVKELKEAEA